jgi:hypothetical protein
VVIAIELSVEAIVPDRRRRERTYQRKPEEQAAAFLLWPVPL